MDAPPGVPGVSKIHKNVLQIKVLRVLGLLAYKTLRIGYLGLSYFPFIFLCAKVKMENFEKKNAANSKII